MLRIVHYKGRDQEPLVEWIASEFCRDPLISACSAPGYAPGKEHSPVLMREVLALNKILIKAGFWGSTQSLLPHRRHIGCYSVSPKNYTITPEGYLCDCAHDLNSVHDSVRSRKNPEVRRAFLRETFSSECRICRLLPVCQGGCRVAELGSAPMTQCLPEKSIIAELMEMQDDYRRKYEKRYG